MLSSAETRGLKLFAITDHYSEQARIKGAPFPIAKKYSSVKASNPQNEIASGGNTIIRNAKNQ